MSDHILHPHSNHSILLSDGWHAVNSTPKLVSLYGIEGLQWEQELTNNEIRHEFDSTREGMISEVGHIQYTVFVPLNKILGVRSLWNDMLIPAPRRDSLNVVH